MKKLPGFTLQEMLIVLGIIGILVLLALPKLMPLITKAKSTEAQIQLKHVYTLEQSYYYLHSKYSESLDDIGFEQVALSTDGGKANYKIEIIEATPKTFVARATAIVDFDGDGQLDVWEVDENNDIRNTERD